MAEFDSPEVRALVSGSQGPFDVGERRRELELALAGPALSDLDRAQVLVCLSSVAQGSVALETVEGWLDEALNLVDRKVAPRLTLHALTIAASASGALGNLDRCVERCLDYLHALGGDPDGGDGRSSINFAVALCALGAYTQSAFHSARAVEKGMAEDDPVVMTVAAFNLAVALCGALLHDIVEVDDVQVQAQLTLADRVSDRALRQLTPGSDLANLAAANMAHIAFVRGDFDAAHLAWGDLDTLTAHPDPSIRCMFGLIEVPLRIDRGQLRRAMMVLDHCLDEIRVADSVPYRRHALLSMRAQVLRELGDVEAAYEGLELASSAAVALSSRVPDVLIRQIDRRVELESNRRALMVHTTRLAETALVDSLSGVANRRALDLRIDEMRTGPESIATALMFEIDDFANVNEDFGRLGGDRVIKVVGRIASGACSDADQVYRYGGDEFIVMPGDGRMETATQIGTRIRDGFRHEQWSEIGVDRPVTVSIGIGTGSTVAFELVLQDADARLYEAKREGTNLIRPHPFGAVRIDDERDDPGSVAATIA